MRRLATGVFVFLLVLTGKWTGFPTPVPPAAHAIDEAERLWTVGARAFEDGLYDLSVRELTRLSDRYPDHPRVPEATLLIGQARLAQKAYQAALDAFRRAQSLPLVPGRPGEARFWEAETLFRMKRYADAYDLYGRVLTEHPGSPVAPDALYGLAWSALELNKREVAASDFRKLIFSYPDHALAAPATLYLARTLLEIKRPEEAVELLRAFPAKYPAHKLAPDARYLLGQALIAAGNTREGVEELRGFAAAYPSHNLAAQARRVAADTVMRKGSRAELADEYKRLLGQSPPTADALYDAGVIASKLGRSKDAEAAWTRLRKEFPDHALSRRAALELSQAAFTRNAFKDSSALAQVAAKSSEADVRAEALVLLGESELRLKRYPSAHKAFQQAVDAPGQEPALRYRALAGIGLVMEEQQEWAQAAKYYDEVASKSPDATLRNWAKERRAAVAERTKSRGEPKASPKSSAPGKKPGSDTSKKGRS